MDKLNVIAVFDVGKTNKKLFLLDEEYHIINERTVTIAETVDEDGEPCENFDVLENFIKENFLEIVSQKQYRIKAINFSGYGASLVYLNKDNKRIGPLYNYLKKYPHELQEQFYNAYGGEEVFAFQTASPVLGSLNSGMQLYRMKYNNKELFHQIKFALHLPQYLSFLITSQVHNEITSVGCHTNFWNFQNNDYHEWVSKEAVLEKLPPLFSAEKTMDCVADNHKIKVGVGLHDSSAALIPYLKFNSAPFLLISTGTWCISLNPFNYSPLTQLELQLDCLYYLNYKGKRVKASRFFAGYFHEEELIKICSYYNEKPEFFTAMPFDESIYLRLLNEHQQEIVSNFKAIPFKSRVLDNFRNAAEAYHQLLMDIVSLQFISTQLIMGNVPIENIFVDGGFCKNEIFMKLISKKFKEYRVFGAYMPQASVMGAALVIHPTWNPFPLPENMIEVIQYTC